MVSPLSPELRVSAYRVTELPDSLPRVDAIVNTVQPRSEFRAGSNATISGEGFSEVTAVTIDDLPVRIVSQSDSAIEFEIPVTLPPGLTPLTLFSGEVRLLKADEVVWRILVQIYPPLVPQPGFP